jgi:hypothetical protein
VSDHRRRATGIPCYRGAITAERHEITTPRNRVTPAAWQCGFVAAQWRALFSPRFRRCSVARRRDGAALTFHAAEAAQSHDIRTARH